MKNAKVHMLYYFIIVYCTTPNRKTTLFLVFTYHGKGEGNSRYYKKLDQILH